MLEALIVEHHLELSEASFIMFWKKGWRPDADNILTGARIKKASEVDQELEEFDFAVFLNFELWNETKISDEQKQIIIDHELWHAAPEMDRDGEQKKDDRGRFCWRLRKHPITEFPEIISRYGLKKVTGLNARLLAALDDEKGRSEVAADTNDSKRPLLQQAERKGSEAAPATAPDKPASEPEAWRNHKLAVLKGKLTEKQFDALEATHLKTLGDLQAKMNQHGGFWARELGVHGRHTLAIEDAFNAYIMAQQ